MKTVASTKFTTKKERKLKDKFTNVYDQDRRYIDLQVAHYFHRLEMKIADTKGELLNWFVKMFIGQVTGFISVFVALASIIRG